MNVPEFVIKTVNKLLFNFLWNSEREKVKRKSTTQHLEYGGLKMIDLQNQIRALKIKWISRLFSEKNSGLWIKIANYWFKQIGGLNFVLNLNCKSIDVTEITREKIPKFYTEVLQSWFTLKEKNTTNVIEEAGVLQNQIIWNNSDIKFRNKLLMFKKWKDAGIVYLSDLVISNRFINLTELRQLVRCPNNVFNLQKLLTAITQKWKMLNLKNKI